VALVLSGVIIVLVAFLAVTKWDVQESHRRATRQGERERPE
jgi:hypothetical protein